MMRHVTVGLWGATDEHCRDGDKVCQWLQCGYAFRGRPVWHCRLFLTPELSDRRLSTDPLGYGDPPRRCEQCKEAEVR